MHFLVFNKPYMDTNFIKFSDCYNLTITKFYKISVHVRPIYAKKCKMHFLAYKGLQWTLNFIKFSVHGKPFTPKG